MAEHAQQLVMAVIYFGIGLGLGLSVFRIWKYIALAVVATLLASLLLPAFGFAETPTPSDVVGFIIIALQYLAALVAETRYGLAGFAAGLLLAAISAIRRAKRGD